MLLRVAPGLFVLLWSTGWINAQAASPYSEPLTFLALRYALAAVALAVLVMALGAPWPRSRRIWAHGLLSGVLLHALYLGGVWWAIDQGLPTPISGLIAAVQPLLTAGLAVGLIGERLQAGQWAGLCLGLIGLLLGLGPKVLGAMTSLETGVTLFVGVNVVAMVSVTLGTLYQKRFLSGESLPGLVMVQNVGACLATLPIVWALESGRIDWTPVAQLSMVWSVLGLSLGAIGLMLWMIRQGAVSRVASLIYLIPPAVAIQAYLFFGETLSPLQVAGMAVTVVGVYLVNRAPTPERAAA